MKELHDALVLVSGIQNDGFRNLIEEHDLRAGNDINRKTDFKLVDPPYKVERNWNTGNLDDDLFTLEELEGHVVVPRKADQARSSLTLVLSIKAVRSFVQGSSISIERELCE